MFSRSTYRIVGSDQNVVFEIEGGRAVHKNELRGAD